MNKAQANAFVAALNKLCKEHGFSLGHSDDFIFMEPLVNKIDHWEILPPAIEDGQELPRIEIWRRWDN